MDRESNEGSLNFADEEYFDAVPVQAPEEPQEEGLLCSCMSKCSRILPKFLKCMGVTNINLVFFIIVLSCGIVLALSVAIKKPSGISESYIHYFFVIFMAIGALWMWGACACRTPPCGCCVVRREMGTQIPCYMIIALTFFCIGSCFITGVDFLSFLYTLGCDDKTLVDKNKATSEGVYDLVKIVFLIFQLHFFCRFSGNAFYSRWCTSFFILLIIAVNLTTWVYFIVDESVEHSSPNYTNCADLNEMNRFVEAADIYLYPFHIEYTVMSSVLLLLMWFELRKKKHRANPPQEHNPNDRDETCLARCCSRVKNTLKEMCQPSQPYVSSDPKTMFFWKSAIVGYTFGVLILIAYLVLIVLSAIEFETSAEYYYVVRIVLFLLMTFACILGLIFLPKPRHGSQTKLHTRVDSILIMIGVSGCYVMMFCETISAISDIDRCTQNAQNATNKNIDSSNSSSNMDKISNTATHYCKYLGFFIADNVMGLFQFSFQAVFIVKALRRGGEEVSLSSMASLSFVRNASAVLSLGNFGIWTMDTFELKDIKTLNAIETSAYGSTWHILVHIVYPLCIFFRLHSAFCFFEIVINRFGETAQPRLGNYGPIRRRHQYRHYLQDGPTRIQRAGSF